MHRRFECEKPSFGLVLGGEITKSYILPINDNSSEEPVLSFAYAKHPRLAVRKGSHHVVKVYPTRHVAEVCDGVVGRGSVDVVDIQLRPFSMNVEPCKTVRQVRVTINPDGYVSVFPPMTGDRSCLYTATTKPTVSEQSGERVVVEQFPQPFKRKMWFIHATSKRSSGRAGETRKRLAGPPILSQVVPIPKDKP